MFPPSRLFKYFAPERTSVISEALVRYTPLGAFNDPFEGRPDITTIALPNRARNEIESIVPSEAKIAYQKLPREVRRRMSFEIWKRKLEEETARRMPDMLEAIHAATPQVRALLRTKFDDILGVFCLTSKPDNLLMWAHYASSHTGFVLEFDVEHPYFNAKRGSEDEFGHLRKVDYRSLRPRLPLERVEATELFLVKIQSGSTKTNGEYLDLCLMQQR